MAKKVNQNPDPDVVIVTPEGFAEMQEELEERLVKAEEIAREIDEARKMGDLKENEPFQSGMQKKELNDARIDDLKYLISVAQVVENQSKTVIGVGSTVELERVDNKTKKTVTLVGKQAAQESDPLSGKISIDSPLGKSLESTGVGTEIEVQLPVGVAKYKVLKIV